MAFEGLSSRLQEITRKLRGKARISESDLKEVLREIMKAQFLKILLMMEKPIACFIYVLSLNRQVLYFYNL